MTETQLLHAFMAAAPYSIKDVFIERRNIINVETKFGQRVRNGIKGQADAFSLSPGGLHVELEAKSATGRLAEHQRKWQALCERRNIPHMVLVARHQEPNRETIARWIEELKTCIESHAS